MTIITDDFITKLGTVSCYIESNSSIISKEDIYAETEGHIISLHILSICDNWLPEGMKTASSIGWRWFIEKINDNPESLTITCKITDANEHTTFGGDTGQYLDAIEVSNMTDMLHIGTEDGELLQSRAQSSDWMPNRFREQLSDTNSFTTAIDFGFKTVIPPLYKSEKIYFHYMVATNPIRASIGHPDEIDLSTWFAVDQHKPFLDKTFFT